MNVLLARMRRRRVAAVRSVMHLRNLVKGKSCEHALVNARPAARTRSDPFLSSAPLTYEHSFHLSFHFLSRLPRRGKMRKGRFFGINPIFLLKRTAGDVDLK